MAVDGRCCFVEMALSKISEPSCKLQTLQKDLRLAINMSDSVDQPLHVGAAVNEVPVCLQVSTVLVSAW